MIIYGNELYHYGIKGQHWGLRRYQNEDGSYTPEGQAENNGHGRYSEVDDSKSSRNSTIISNSKFHLSDKQKKYIKIGAAAVGTALVAIGGYELYKNRNLISNYIKLGKKNVDFLMNSGKFDYLTKDILGMDQIKEISNEADRSLISKEVLEIADQAKDINLVHGKGNCVSCAASGVLNQLGIPCRALPDLPKRPDGTQPGYLLEDLVKCFKGATIKEPFKDGGVLNRRQAYNKTLDILKSYGDGATGIMATFKPKFIIDDNGDSKIVKQGHEVYWKVIKGTVQFFDGQGQIYSDKIKGQSNWYADEWNDIFKNARFFEETSIVRLDGLEIDKTKIKDFVELLSA